MNRLILFAVCGLALLAPVEAQAATGTVEGDVTPLAWAQEVEVCVVESRPSETCTAPEADGSYSLYVNEPPPGGVRIEFVPSFRSGLLKQYYDGVARLSEAKAIVLAPGSTAKNIDASLREGGSIEGAVTDASGGERLAEVEVCAVSVDASTAKICGETDAAGGYELHSLPTGSYRVGFRGQGRSAGYESWRYPSAVAVTEGETTTGIDAGLVVGARIAGIVTAAADDAPLEGITVCLFAVSESTAQTCTGSGEGGGYSFQGLPGGAYQIGFALGAAEIAGTGATTEVGGLVPQYYEGAATRAQATTIHLLGSEAVDGVDAALSTPAAPATSTPAPPVASPIAAAAPTVSEPKSKRRACRKPERKKKLGGKVRCVKPAKHKKKRRVKHNQHQKAPHRRGGRSVFHGRAGQRARRARPHEAGLGSINFSAALPGGRKTGRGAQP